MRACLDACVLVPTALRGILLRMAEADAFEPIWSDRIFEEWRRADMRLHPDAEAVLGATQALLRDRWRDASIVENTELEDRIALPDADDRHVLATAVLGQADILVTANLRDFPLAATSRFGIALRHPDAFLLELLEVWRDPVQGAVDEEYRLAMNVTKQTFSKRAFLKRIGLPRTAKALL
ncbi:MAG: PIN domain-containing protein [Pseudomonadota bacterium]